MDEPKVILNGVQIFETDSPEAAEIIELTNDMIAGLDASAGAEEQPK